MSKKLFVLMLVSMFLLTIAVVVLALTGHADLVRSAGQWVTSSIESVIGTLGVVGVLILVVLLTEP